MAARLVANAYLATLNRLEPLVEEAEHVVPGHGAPIDGTRAAAILREDRAYLEALLADGEAAKLPLARRNGGQRKIHAENVRAPRVSLHDRDPRLEQTILAAARERLAADPPALGRTAAARGVRRRRDHAPRGSAPSAPPRCCSTRAAVGDPDRPPALPRVHPGRAGAGLRARRRAAGRELDLRRVVAGGLGRRARRERGAELARAARRACPNGAGGCFVQGGTNGNLSALHAARAGGAARPAPRPPASRAAPTCTRRCGRCCG